MDIILQLLRATKFPKCKSRPNVADSYEGFCLGEVNYRGQTFLGGRTRGPSKHNRYHPELFEALQIFMAHTKPKFTYTTIQINKNVECRPHIDTNNVGPSYIIALGNFTGGELMLEGRALNIKNRLVKFDGTKGHWTSPFQGERYSIIFFTHTFKPPPYHSRFIVVTKKGLFYYGQLIVNYNKIFNK